MPRFMLIYFLVLMGVACLVQADTTIDSTNFCAYAANVGWVNARGDVTHGALIGRSYCTGCLWSANCGWISLGNGPTNGWLYSNASTNDWGVNHDGQGRLSGYAYGANIGWINFEQTYGQPMIDLQTGNLSGYIYGANVGWISLSNTQARVMTDRLDSGPDSDGDGLPDAYEYSHTNTLAALDGRLGHDADGDGVSDLQEAAADTDPFDNTSRLAITDSQRLSETNRLTWTIRPTRLYRVEQTTVLTNGATWSDSGLGQFLPAAGATMTRDVLSPASTTGFYRVKAVVPLSP